MNKTYLLIGSLILIILYVYLTSGNCSSIEFFSQEVKCNDKLATNNYEGENNDNIYIDNSSCNYDDNVICNKFTASNYKKIESSDKRCNDIEASNYEADENDDGTQNTKPVDNSKCIYVDNRTCKFNSSNNKINNFKNLTSTNDEFSKLLSNKCEKTNDNGAIELVALEDEIEDINYNNYMTTGPMVKDSENRDRKLELYNMLFKPRSLCNKNEVIDVKFNNYVWDVFGRIDFNKQLNEDVGHGEAIELDNEGKIVVRTDRYGKKYHLRNYGIDGGLPINYYELVQRMNNLDDKKHVALAINNDGTKFAIAVGRDKASAADMALARCIDYKNLDELKNSDNYFSKTHNELINDLIKAKSLSVDVYNDLKSRVEQNENLNPEENLLYTNRRNLEDNKLNPAGILMINNERFNVHESNQGVLDICAFNIVNNNVHDRLCTQEEIDNNGCHEAVVLGSFNDSNGKKKCRVYHEYKNYLKDDEYDYTKVRDEIKFGINDDGKSDIIKSTIDKCNKKNENCVVYSIDGSKYLNNDLYN